MKHVLVLPRIIAHFPILFYFHPPHPYALLYCCFKVLLRDWLPTGIQVCLIIMHHFANSSVLQSMSRSLSSLQGSSGKKHNNEHYLYCNNIEGLKIFLLPLTFIFPKTRESFFWDAFFILLLKFLLSDHCLDQG